MNKCIFDVPCINKKICTGKQFLNCTHREDTKAHILLRLTHFTAKIMADNSDGAQATTSVFNMTTSNKIISILTGIRRDPDDYTITLPNGIKLQLKLDYNRGDNSIVLEVPNSRVWTVDIVCQCEKENNESQIVKG